MRGRVAFQRRSASRRTAMARSSSLVVIPLGTKQPPSITYRWWIQFFGHIPFVASPIVWSLKPARR
ncbi:MAG TPA: hypothetical protein VIK50_12660 [Gemmatimonadaceae bacterium]